MNTPDKNNKNKKNAEKLPHTLAFPFSSFKSEVIHGHTYYFYQNTKLFNLKPRTLSASNNWSIKKGVHDHLYFSAARSYWGRE